MAQVSGCTCAACSGVTGMPCGCGVGPIIWAPQIIGQCRKPIAARAERARDREWPAERERAQNRGAGSERTARPRRRVCTIPAQQFYEVLALGSSGFKHAFIPLPVSMLGDPVDTNSTK